ncbi:MAG: N-acetylmuramoyl-L-alanine amidase-like domain-containing protein [Myxococcota bacterium]
MGRKLAVAGAALVVLVCSGAAVSRRYADMTDEEVSQAIARAQSIPSVGERVQAVSEGFLGTPYLLGNMGEGPDGDGRDKDPRYNVKSMDCTTMVEHALAFALSDSLPAARQRLDQIRYTTGKVGYGTRRHWPEAQWVRGLVEEGYLQDVTSEVAGKAVPVETASVTIDPALFKKSVHAQSMPLTDEEVPRGTFSVPFIPMERLPDVLTRLEPGLVINIVKAPKEGLLVRISHQGLVVKKDGKVFIRHASSVGQKAVIDEAVPDFLERQRKAKSWPTVGFQFLRPKAPTR